MTLLDKYYDYGMFYNSVEHGFQFISLSARNSAKNLFYNEIKKRLPFVDSEQVFFINLYYK